MLITKQTFRSQIERDYVINEHNDDDGDGDDDDLYHFCEKMVGAILKRNETKIREVAALNRRPHKFPMSRDE